MILARILLVAFNVAIIGFLIYRMFEFSKRTVSTSKKATFIIGGIVLLLIPFGILLRFFAPSAAYLVIYPVAIGLFLYLTKQL
jgi:glycopeptide antibiotics resistance protein